VVKPVSSRQDVTPSTEGAIGRAVVPEEPRGDAADAPPATAYLVQVAARWDPTPEEFTGTRYAEWLRAKAYDSSALFNPTATNLRNQKGFVVEQLARFFEDWDGIKKMYDIRTRQPIEMPAVAR